MRRAHRTFRSYLLIAVGQVPSAAKPGELMRLTTSRFSSSWRSTRKQSIRARTMDTTMRICSLQMVRLFRPSRVSLERRYRDAKSSRRCRVADHAAARTSGGSNRAFVTSMSTTSSRPRLKELRDGRYAYDRSRRRSQQDSVRRVLRGYLRSDRPRRRFKQRLHHAIYKAGNPANPAPAAK